jgi:hypothetical protein
VTEHYGARGVRSQAPRNRRCQLIRGENLRHGLGSLTPGPFRFALAMGA